MQPSIVAEIYAAYGKTDSAVVAVKVEHVERGPEATLEKHDD